MNVDPQMIHVFDPAFDVAALKRCSIDAAFELFVVKIAHTAVRIGRLQNHGPVETLELVDILFGEYVRLKIDDHVIFSSQSIYRA